MNEQQKKDWRSAVSAAQLAPVTGCVVVKSDTVFAIESALRAAVPDDARRVIKLCQSALAEELSAWDIDPPIHHVKEAHDACSAWLEASPQQAPQAAQPDPWAEYLKEGETPFERFMRERADLDALLTLYKNALEKAAQPVQPSEPAVWKSPEDTDNAQKLVWLRENGVVFLGYYFEQPFREYRDGDGFYVGQQDAEAYWARHEDGEPCEPDGWCQLLPPLADAQQAGAVLKPEPVAFDRWWFDESTVDALEAASSVRAECCLAWDAAVAATLQQSEQVRKPLSDAEIMSIVAEKPFNSAIGFARAIERAHHTKES